ncbi:MAG: hypothetical protein HRT57_00835 [Crocinitomicaceae bacterium]|nr:hypothetical protein [Crocinitomicaceae bacterium]
MLRNVSYALVSSIMLIGFLFKFMHWPGAGPTLAVSLAAMVVLLIEYIIDKRKSKSPVQNILYPLLGVVLILGILFKIMNWPTANVLISISLVSMSVAFFACAYNIRKSILAILPMLIGISLFLSLFKIMHWPMLPYAFNTSLISFSILLPIVLFVRGIQLKPTAPDLSRHLFILGGLTIFSSSSDYYNIFYPKGIASAEPMASILLILILVILILVIKKILQLENLKERFRNEYLFLQCLGVIFTIAVLFQVLVDKSYI